jgi:hypothetical protein
MNKNIFKIKKIKELPFCSAQHCFGLFIILVFFAMVCGAFLFYKYSIMPENQQIESSGATLEFKEKTYQEILQVWEAQERKLEQSESKQYPSLFKQEPEPEPEQGEEQEQEQEQEQETESI